MYIYAYVYKYVCVFVNMYIHIFLYIYMCVYSYIYIWIYIYVCIYLYIHIPRRTCKWHHRVRESSVLRRSFHAARAKSTQHRHKSRDRRVWVDASRALQQREPPLPSGQEEYCPLLLKQSREESDAMFASAYSVSYWSRLSREQSVCLRQGAAGTERSTRHWPAFRSCQHIHYNQKKNKTARARAKDRIAKACKRVRAQVTMTTRARKEMRAIMLCVFFNGYMSSVREHNSGSFLSSIGYENPLMPCAWTGPKNVTGLGVLHEFPK